jgi:hypothetical protein
MRFSDLRLLPMDLRRKAPRISPPSSNDDASPSSHRARSRLVSLYWEKQNVTRAKRNRKRSSRAMQHLRSPRRSRRTSRHHRQVLFRMQRRRSHDNPSQNRNQRRLALRPTLRTPRRRTRPTQPPPIRTVPIHISAPQSLLPVSRLHSKKVRSPQSFLFLPVRSLPFRISVYTNQHLSNHLFIPFLNLFRIDPHLQTLNKHDQFSIRQRHRQFLMLSFHILTPSQNPQSTTNLNTLATPPA